MRGQMSRRRAGRRDSERRPAGHRGPRTAAGKCSCRRSAPSPRLAFSPDEAATILGVGRDTVYDLLRTGQLKSRKAGARRIIGRKQLEDYLAGGDDAA